MNRLVRRTCRFLLILTLPASGSASLLAQGVDESANESADQAPGQAVILQYHHVSTQTPPSTSLSLEDFSTHMHYLKDNGFTVLPLEDVVHALRDGTSLPDRSAVITFDDAYVSVYEAALPLLRELGFPFTVFIPAGLISSNDRLYATWDQLRTMAEAGATLANHTMTHPYMLERLSGEDEAAWLERLRKEIVDAEAVIEAETGQSHRLLAYPYGEYDPAIQRLTEELGFIGIGQHSGPISAASDFTALPRFPFSGIYVSMNTLPTKVNSLAFNVQVVEPLSAVTTLASPSASLDFDGDYRLDALNCFNNNEPMQLTRLDAAEQTFLIETTVRNESRRFRYNCTAPGPDGRFYWYSVPWVNAAVAE
ncbi:MAG TPA: polysaccharide deacetylase family protein [Pseudomonadaceae bacterium]|nr:polysaccharide deacetylase family protein [Pseudomonadaceae bacterium]